MGSYSQKAGKRTNNELDTQTLAMMRKEQDRKYMMQWRENHRQRKNKN